VRFIPLKANKDKKASAKANNPKEPTGQWDLSHPNPTKTKKRRLKPTIQKNQLVSGIYPTQTQQRQKSVG